MTEPPALHELAVAVAAPAMVLSARDGQLRPGGVEGWYVDDTRLLDRIELRIDGSGLELIRSDVSDPLRHEFGYAARRLGGNPHDPTVVLDRTRVLGATTLEERVVVTSAAREPVRLELTLDLGSDLAPLPRVRRGEHGVDVAAEVGPRSLSWSGDGTGAALEVVEGEALLTAGSVTWVADLAPGSTYAVGVRLRAATEPLFRRGGEAPWRLRVEADDRRLSRVVEQSLADLAGLLLQDGDDRFLAAGSPWFLTLFGRDSLWAARLLLPLGTELALSTLRVLARRQGRRYDEETEEAPGKILHEVRRPGIEHILPPVYYGSVDATALFVSVLAEAHRWGADADEVRELLPAARGCLRWMRDQSAETGWLTYVDHTGRGLANQGWKDSPDAVQFADGRLAEPPIALCEVQGYAYAAAVDGAALLAAYDEAPEDGLLEWAEDLRTRFRRDFWVESEDGGHPAVALDREGRRAGSLTSNIGHLLGTGILTPDQVDRVADLLVGDALSSGFGLRTLSDRSPAFSRTSYHGGSVWPHDTAIAVRGLAAEGRLEEAAHLTAGLVRAAEVFDHRLPELYGGDDGRVVTSPSAYPAACRPQAWAAAAPVAALVAVTGLEVDVPAGVTRVPATTSPVLGAFRLEGLRAGPASLTLDVAADGRTCLA